MGYRDETWQNEGEYLGLPLFIVAYLCKYLSGCLCIGLSEGYKCLGTVLLKVP